MSWLSNLADELRGHPAPGAPSGPIPQTNLRRQRIIVNCDQAPVVAPANTAHGVTCTVPTGPPQGRMWLIEQAIVYVTEPPISAPVTTFGVNPQQARLQLSNDGGITYKSITAVENFLVTAVMPIYNKISVADNERVKFYIYFRNDSNVSVTLNPNAEMQYLECDAAGGQLGGSSTPEGAIFVIDD